MICSHCLRENPEEAAYCAGCGRKTDDDGTPWTLDEVIAAPASELAQSDPVGSHPFAEPAALAPAPEPSAAPAPASPAVVPAATRAAPAAAAIAPGAPAPAAEPKRRVKPTVWVAIAAVLIAVTAVGIPPLVRELRFRSNSEALTSDDPAARADAAAALAQSKDSRAVDLLAEAMADEAQEVREAAGEGLVGFGTAAIGTCVPLLEGDDPEARMGAIEVVLRLGDQSAVEPLCDLVDDTSVDAATRKAAIAALVELSSAAEADGHPSVAGLELIPHLIGVVDDKNESVRLAAIEGLERFPSSQAVPSLVAAFRTSTPKTRKAAGKTLQAVGGASVYPLMCCASDSRVSREAIALVRRIGPTHADQVVRAVRHKSAAVRKAAIGVLVGYRYKQSDAIGALTLRLRKDPDPKVRAAAAEALGVFDASSTDDLLFTTLCKDSNKTVRAAAATALVRIRGAKDRALLYALRDRSTAAVANLYKRFIRWGESEALDIMCDAVIEHGYPTMVVDYLNCGSSQLDAAARRWCSSHGYRVITSSGGGWSGPRWGGY